MYNIQNTTNQEKLTMLEFLGHFIVIEAIAFICTWHKQKSQKVKKIKVLGLKD